METELEVNDRRVVDIKVRKGRLQVKATVDGGSVSGLAIEQKLPHGGGNLSWVGLNDMSDLDDLVSLIGALTAKIAEALGC